MGGWLYELKIRLNSAFNSVEIEVEVEAELGKRVLSSHVLLCKVFHSQFLSGSLLGGYRSETDRILSVLSSAHYS